MTAYRAKPLLQDLVALIESQTGDSPTPGQVTALVAHDWGGALAWNLAALHPELLRQLVIINAPHPGNFQRELSHSPAQQAASDYMLFLARSDAPALLAENDFARLWPFFTGMAQGSPLPWLDASTRERYRAVWRLGLHGPCAYYAASPLRPPTAQDPGASAVVLPRKLLDVLVPTLVIWGLGDTALPPALLDGLADHVPQLRIERVADASHWIVHEQPDLVRTLLADFLKE